MRSFTAVVACLLILVGLEVMVLGGDTEPPRTVDEVSNPAVQFAKTASKKIDRDEATRKDATARLAKAVESYNPSSLNIMPEGATLEAFRESSAEVLKSGKDIIQLHERWEKASVALADSLRKAPAYYRGAAKSMREKAQAMKFAAIKERYFLTADIWDQLAIKAEQRVKDLGLEGNSGGVIELVREEVQFLTDFIATLDGLPRVSGEEGGRYKELLEVLRKHAQKSDDLHKQLKSFRDKLKTDSRGEEEAATKSK